MPIGSQSRVSMGSAPDVYNMMGSANVLPQSTPPSIFNTNNMRSPNLSRVSNFFGRGTGSQFGLASGVTNKFNYDSVNDIVNWKGMSGILQFFHRWPMGFGNMKKSDWAKTFNQIFWNIAIFVVLFGFIYAGMIQSGALGVPDGIKEQTPNPVAQGMYFSVITMTTLGFGDITPATVGGQVMVTLHILLFFIFNFIWTLDFKPEKLFSD